MMFRTKVGSTLGLLGLVVGALLLLGPRPRIETSPSGFDVPRDPAALVDYLAAAESRFDDIVPGTERTIVWDNPSAPSRTPISVVYLHGFSATHRETAPLAEELASALRANLYLSRLTGHGRTGEALGGASASDWIADAAEAVEIGAVLGERVIILGVSTGATLATWAAARPEASDRIAGLVLVSPNYGVRDSRARFLTLPWGAWVANRLYGPEYSFEPANEGHATYWTERYPVRSLAEMAALTRLVDREVLAEVRAPTIVFLDPEDQIIDPARVSAAFAELGSPEKELALASEVEDPAHHVLAGDILSPGLTDWVLARSVLFLEEALER
jgi:esterase/lipase